MKKLALLFGLVALLPAVANADNQPLPPDQVYRLQAQPQNGVIMAHWERWSRRRREHSASNSRAARSSRSHYPRVSATSSRYRRRDPRARDRDVTGVADSLYAADAKDALQLPARTDPEALRGARVLAPRGCGQPSLLHVHRRSGPGAMVDRRHGRGHPHRARHRARAGVVVSARAHASRQRAVLRGGAARHRRRGVEDRRHEGRHRARARCGARRSHARSRHAAGRTRGHQSRARQDRRRRAGAPRRDQLRGRRRRISPVASIASTSGSTTCSGRATAPKRARRVSAPCRSCRTRAWPAIAGSRSRCCLRTSCGRATASACRS